MSNQAASQLNMADAIRALSMDAVQKANSGHPGAPMGMAEIALALWHGHLRHNPANPAWADRDRFVLSNGHGSMLIYSLLHLTGYDLSIEELRNFRQMHSKTPGHPEVGITPGVETTTGPLGQGVSNAVGMALAEALLAAEFNRPGLPIVDHFTYAFVGDGCLMEGISHEVASLAGTLKLSKLVVLYDSNGISIDGEIKNWFADDTAKRFEAYGWNVIRHVDGHDAQAVDAAIAQAKAQAGKHGGPTLIECRTVIGKGAPTMAGTDKVHGSPLGDKEIAATREAIGWPYAPFEIPAEVYAFWDGKAKGAQTEGAWNELFARYAAQFPEQAAEFERRMRGDLPAEFAEKFAQFLAETNQKQETVATRKASQFSITALAGMLPELLGGSADLTGSNYTDWKGVAPVRAGNDGIEFGRHINYGVREFGMAAAMNGIALHGGYLPFGGTFLVFSDYARNGIRMAALMRQRVIHVLTHDSIGLGEDGPTHQPVEHAASLRLIPNLDVWRPCDRTETAVAWIAAVGRTGEDGGPSALLLSRQSLPQLSTRGSDWRRVLRGGYVLHDTDGAKAIILATGSEVSLAAAAHERLASFGLPTRVVSMPCTRRFDEQPESYRHEVLTPGLPCVAVEAGATDCWWKYVGRGGAVVGLDRFGASASAGELYRQFGITAEAIVDAVLRICGGD